MERRVGGGDVQRGAAAAGNTGAPDGLKLETAAGAGQAATTEENWSALSNLRVAGEAESGEEAAAAQTQPGSIRASAGSSSRHKVRRTSSQVHPTTPLDDDEAMLHDLDAVSKSSLSFILDDQAASAAAGKRIRDDFTSGGKRAAALITRSRSTGDLTGDTPASGRSARAAAGGKQGADGKRRARRPPSRICKHEGCEQYVVDQGLCVRHGGGKRCSTEGCTSRAKHQGRCWRHAGGSTECKVPSCINRAKSRGFCWSHGGGTKCKFDDCEKIAISNGLCWAHGGGKRCAVEGCMRQAYERTDNLCNNHYQERQQGATAGSSPGSSVTTVTEEPGEVVAASSMHPDDEEKPPAPSSDHKSNPWTSVGT
ncbi:hypothetical protein PHYSODRAFT_480227 [Phytophthora sojae]|uniref:WRKY19-like zinc finger domain-containing protein n=1 Tax=Phytophthora sojae (strain P6497) TaxID=1094619 RepID=G4YSN2_PHYSP|nr:hypothetical protein PHYSODRAFT_480227 [Phytophthora sojae]EGZ23525.1 hypothetical protein PHYSODRAFT_480227 [Phytophthora sojae]|eukprot:XP_009518813.1 hypothetical protein PHYSODRAFT_480227 [Phytophthora sojae]